MLDYLSQFTNSILPNGVYNIYNYASDSVFAEAFGSMHISASNIRIG